MPLDADHHDFPNATSLLCFREFVSLMQNPWMTGLSNSEGRLWKDTMPQLCRSDLTLRNAAMAIGAISLWRANTTTLDVNATSSGAAFNTHYLQALAFYGEALKRQNRHASLQSAAFLSLLLVIFESIRRQRRAALNHVNHGMALLLSFVTGPRADDNISGFAPNPRPVLAQLADVFTHLATQTRVVLQGRVGLCSPLPDLARGLRERDMTMDAFVLLLSRVAGQGHLVTPSVFSSLDEFEDQLVSLIRRQAEMGPIMLRAMEDTGITESEDQQHITALFPTLLRDPNVQHFCNDTRQAMEALERAFIPLFDKVTLSTDLDSPTYLRAIHLRLRHLAVYILNNPPQYADIEAMITLGPRFREFVSLAEVMLRVAKGFFSTNPVYRLCVDGGLAWHLLQVALHCRDPTTRDQASLLLREYPGQDGLWSTRALYALASRNRLLERVNANGDEPQTQWQRLWRREYYLEDGGERLVFRFLDRDGASEEWALVEEVAELDDNAVEVEWKQQPRPTSGRLLLKEATPCGRRDTGL